MAANATMIWRSRPSGNNSNGGGFDPGVGSPGTDYSQQNAAQVAFNGTTVTATTAGVSAVITISGYTVGATDPGNTLHITGGTNFLAGWYEILSQSGSTWTLDRNCTTGAGSGMTGSMGGGWADPFTNMTSSGPLVPGNSVGVLGTGIPNPSSYTVDYTMTSVGTMVGGDNTNGFITWFNDPATPNYKAWPDATGGMPVIKFNSSSTVTWSQLNKSQGLLFLSGSNARSTSFQNSDKPIVFQGCVWDCNGQTTGETIYAGVTGCIVQFYGCEFWDNNPGGTRSSPSSNPVINATGNGSVLLDSCNIHDNSTAAILCYRGFVLLNTIIAKNADNAVVTQDPGGSGLASQRIKNCTIDGNFGNGMEIDSANAVGAAAYVNNIISNHTGVGKSGIKCDTGTTAANDRIKGTVDFNSFYNNTANYTTISAGVHDTALGADPYVSSAIQNYTLA